MRDEEERVALHYAAETMDVETFEAIYKQDPSLLDCQDKNGQVVLLWNLQISLSSLKMLNKQLK